MRFAAQMMVSCLDSKLRTLRLRASSSMYLSPSRKSTTSSSCRKTHVRVADRENLEPMSAVGELLNLVPSVSDIAPHP
jgi:hypothetical protein